MDQHKAYSQPAQVPSFNHGHMILYFVSCTATDGLPAGDIKSINNTVKLLYDCAWTCTEWLYIFFMSYMPPRNAKGSYLQPPNVY